MFKRCGPVVIYGTYNDYISACIYDKTYDLRILGGETMLGTLKALGEACLFSVCTFVIVGIIGIVITICQEYDIEGMELAIPVMVFLFVIGVVSLVLAKCMGVA